MPFVVASLLLVPLPLLAAVFFHGQPLIFFQLFFPAMAASIGVRFLKKRFPIRRRGVVTMRDDVLFLDAEPLLEQQNIRGIFPVADSENAVLVAERGVRTLRATTIELGSREEANGLRNDLKWDEAHAAQEFTLIARLRLRFFVAVFVVVGAIALLMMVLAVYLRIDPWLVNTIGLTAIAFALFASSRDSRKLVARVRVGTDGLRVKSGGKSRFISYRDIRLVRHTDHDVTLELFSGESIAWSHGDTGFASRFNRKLDPVSPVAALFERIENARALFSSRAEIRSHLLAALKRDGRSLEQWREAATSLSREQYRVAATPRDVLETIVQDSAVAPDVRIGAAIALHADSGTRVRVATETSALPELGKAIDAALDGDDPALEKAIATLKLDA